MIESTEMNKKIKIILPAAALMVMIASTQSFASKRTESTQLDGNITKKVRVGDSVETSPLAKYHNISKEMHMFIIEENYQLSDQARNLDTIADMLLKGFFSAFYPGRRDKITSLFKNIEVEALTSLEYSRVLIEYTKIPVTEELLSYINKGVDQGNAYAQTNLGLMYLYGRGVAQNDQESVRYFKIAAEQGDSLAQFNLGVIYEEGNAGVDKNAQEAVRYYKLAADQGNNMARTYLATMYRTGDDIAQNDQDAFKYFKLAADQGYDDAQTFLSYMYHEGRGVAQNDQEAVRYCKLAAEQGCDSAKDHLQILVGIYPQVLGEVPMKTTFSISQAYKEAFGKILLELDYWIGKTNTENKFEDSVNNPILRKHIKNLVNDTKKFDIEFLEKMFNETGFMVTNIIPLFNVSKETSNEASLYSFNIDNQLYHCFGQEAVQTASKILPLLDKMMNHPDIASSISGFEMASFFLGEDDQDSIDNCTMMIKRLGEIQDTLNQIGQAVHLEIKQGATRRNKDLENYYY